ncbi:hypothetical protein CLOBAR_01238 [Intestinibacter bartlettii DSM 16795]|nr:hypothetical protein CLOBAR_01238 [Intestinibacter bartlettii DSM 16795]
MKHIYRNYTYQQFLNEYNFLYDIKNTLHKIFFILNSCIQYTGYMVL